MSENIIPFQRTDYREEDQLRHVSLTPNFAPHAQGSVLIKFDNTQVICSAILEQRVPKWMIQQGVEGGWITAEYSMLPYSTLTRKNRDSSVGKKEGRTYEIERLIGRALRAVADLSKIPGYTLWIDCDVLQADGGTRCAAITGAYVAAELAVKKLIAEGKIKESLFKDSVAAVSVGVYQDKPILDLNYIEDRDASVDSNIVMTGSGKFVEMQVSGEESTFTDEEMTQLIKLAKKGIQELTQIQKNTLGG